MRSRSNYVDDPIITKRGGISFPLQLELIRIDTARHVGCKREQEIDRFSRLSCVPSRSAKDKGDDETANLDADPSAEHPAARAVATRLVRCQSEALAHHASTLAAAQRAVNRNPTTRCTRSGPRGRGRPMGIASSTIIRPITDVPNFLWF